MKKLNIWMRMIKKLEEKEDNIKKIQKLARNYLEKKKERTLLFEKIISKNRYLKDCKSNHKKDKDSISYLIDRVLSQSDCIKLGYAIEKIFYDIVREKTNLIDIKKKNKKGVKEKDHLFMDNIKKIIYYIEFKSNLNLDTEKSKSTYEKCVEISKELKNQYKDYEINWCLLGCRYVNKEEIPRKIKIKYKPILNNLFGINEYLEMLNVSINLTKKSYRELLNNICNKMYE